MDGLTEGRIVHFVMPNNTHRPAIVVKVWDPTLSLGMVNLTVFVDGRNDIKPTPELNISPTNNETLLMRATSVVFAEEPRSGTWHWIEKA